MKTYFEAYRERIESNTNKFIRLSDSLVKQGFEVFKPKSVNISFIVILKEGKHVNMQFSEVPYKWEFIQMIQPSRSRGSGRLIKIFNDYDKEFSVEEIESLMKDNYVGIELSLNHLIKHSVN